MTLELHNRFRDVIVGFSGAIPAVGTFVSTLLGVFWPARERDIWEQIRHEVEALVNKRVLESELESRRNQLDGFKRNLQAYHDAIGLQKSQALTNLLFDARAIEPFMIGNNANRIHFIPMAAAFAFQHIGVLIEQFQFGAELYGQFNPTWRVDLETTHSRYATFFNTTLPLWRSWRVTQIEGTWWRSSSGGGILNPPRYFANGRVFDHVDGHEQTWRREIRDGDYFRPTVEAYIAERTARLFAEMNSIVNPVVNDLRNTIQQIINSAALRVAGSSDASNFMLALLTSAIEFDSSRLDALVKQAHATYVKELELVGSENIQKVEGEEIEAGSEGRAATGYEAFLSSENPSTS